MAQSEADTIMQNLLAAVLVALVGRPVEMKCDLASDGTIIFRVFPEPRETGSLIGSHGRTARSIRTVMGAASARMGVRYQLDIITPDGEKKEAA